MATILEGLNKLSGALGGAETATENLEALNAIAGALGGETNATNNADAIDQIAEHASGGGGSTASVTFVGEEGLTLFGVLAHSYLEAATNTYTADNPEPFQNGTPKSIPMLNSVTLYDIDCYSDEQTVLQGAVFEVSGSAEITEEGIHVTGDCTITVKAAQ